MRHDARFDGRYPARDARPPVAAAPGAWAASGSSPDDALMPDRRRTERRPPASRRGAPRAPAPAAFPRRTVAVLVLVGLATAWLAGVLPAAVALGYTAMSGVACLLYALDKSASMHGRRRVRERSLHLVAALGGWPGALFAQGAFRHKTAKPRFQLLFWATVAANVAAVAWLLDGSAKLDAGALLPRP
jgi:uncharacterized membrane protein YsdA (DUF1294 family)